MISSAGMCGTKGIGMCVEQMAPPEWDAARGVWRHWAGITMRTKGQIFIVLSILANECQ